MSGTEKSNNDNVNDEAAKLLEEKGKEISRLRSEMSGKEKTSNDNVQDVCSGLSAESRWNRHYSPSLCLPDQNICQTVGSLDTKHQPLHEEEQETHWPSMLFPC